MAKTKKIRAYQMAERLRMKYKEFHAYAQSLGTTFVSAQNSLEEEVALRLIQQIEAKVEAGLVGTDSETAMSFDDMYRADTQTPSEPTRQEPQRDIAPEAVFVQSPPEVSAPQVATLEESVQKSVERAPMYRVFQERGRSNKQRFEGRGFRENHQNRKHMLRQKRW